MIDTKSKRISIRRVIKITVCHKKCALTYAGEVLGEKIPYRGTKRRTPWWGEEAKDSMRLEIEPFRKWMKSRSAEDRRSYEIARSEAQRVKKGAKEESWGKLEKTLNRILEALESFPTA